MTQTDSKRVTTSKVQLPSAPNTPLGPSMRCGATTQPSTGDRCHANLEPRHQHPPLHVTPKGCPQNSRQQSPPGGATNVAMVVVATEASTRIDALEGRHGDEHGPRKRHP
ncbi:hypothetical protein Salat_2780100 [Sesamum alatum]|uniref:Uncharacterized protein n=1 Tax=Sesamum alatum TaxID=300844 RepID=A0AAE2C981_9LAMI|nr:hypothetical protein Salat_2780100 [Sesamum alatum]